MFGSITVAWVAAVFMTYAGDYVLGVACRFPGMLFWATMTMGNAGQKRIALRPWRDALA